MQTLGGIQCERIKVQKGLAILQFKKLFAYIFLIISANFKSALDWT